MTKCDKKCAGNAAEYVYTTADFGEKRFGFVWVKPSSVIFHTVKPVNANVGAELE